MLPLPESINHCYVHIVYSHYVYFSNRFHQAGIKNSDSNRPARYRGAAARSLAQYAGAVIRTPSTIRSRPLPLPVPLPVLLLTLLPVLLLAGCASHARITGRPAKPAVLERNFTRAELLADTDHLYRMLETVHPDLYALVERPRADSLRAVLEDSLRDGMDRIDYWRRIAAAVARFGDGHTSAMLPYESLNEYLEAGGPLLPVDLTLEDRRAYVARDYLAEPALPAGTEVTAINGVPVTALVDDLLPLFSAERLSTRLVWLQNNLRTIFPLLYGWGETFTLDTIGSDGTRHRIACAGAPLDTLRARSQRRTGAPAAPRPPAWAFRRIGEDRIGYLDFRSFSDPAGFNRFLEETFTGIQQQPIEALIIDLRQNGGGNSMLGDALLGYLTDRPFAQVARMDVKMSRPIKAYYKTMAPWWVRWVPGWFFGLFNSQARLLYGARDGEIVTFEQDPVAPEPNPLRYAGPVYVLVGARTFSSATMFAATVKDYGFGILVGDETGGLASHFGDVYTFFLPATRLGIGVSHKRFLRPSGVDDGRGVLPDVEVIATPADLEAGRDPVLETTLRLIRQGYRLPPNPP